MIVFRCHLPNLNRSVLLLLVLTLSITEDKSPPSFSFQTPDEPLQPHQALLRGD